MVTLGKNRDTPTDIMGVGSGGYHFDMNLVVLV